MIVVIGSLGARTGTGEGEGAPAPDGLAPGIARTAAAVGARVELISKVGDDPAGDAVLLALAGAGVGHVATLRDPARLTPVRAGSDDPTDPTDAADDAGHADETLAIDVPLEAPTTETAPAEPQPTLEAADVALALRYLTNFEVLVAVHPSAEVLAEAVSAARWTGARLVVVVEPDADAPAGPPADALVVAAATDDSEGVGVRIGRYAAALSRGDDASAAYRELTAAPTA